MKVLNVILNTGRTVWQGEAIEAGKDLKMYIDYAAICNLTQAQFDELGIEEGDHIEILSPYGDVVVKTVKAKEELPEGMIYVPMGPWANRVIRPDTDSTATPSFKNIPVDIIATDKPVLDMPTLMKGYGKISNY
ncbi:MAG: tungsten-dependent formylmethanofuran dehydrogenase subunit FwdD [Methanobacteriaceae archaeon]